MLTKETFTKRMNGGHTIVSVTKYKLFGLITLYTVKKQIS